MLKCLCLVTRLLAPTATGQQSRAVRWKPALNAFGVTSADKISVRHRG